MTHTYRDEKGELIADPLGLKKNYENWKESITNLDGSINYLSFPSLSNDSSEYLTRHILDLAEGRNCPKGSAKGQRSYVYLRTQRLKMRRLLESVEKHSGKTLFQFTEHDLFNVFNKMKSGDIMTPANKRYTALHNYTKVFYTFWRWLMRVKKKDGVEISDIVIDLDISKDDKPKWEYFTLQDVERMTYYAPNPYYKALAYFLYDSGIRSPKELMNVRAMDITPVPDSNYLFLQVRDVTSKTFGRKIKLMICSDILRKHIEENKLQGEDFIFSKSYAISTRAISRMGHLALGRGKVTRQKNSKLLYHGGITMYDFRHNSVCYYLPIYKSENQMKYRYGWKNASMIGYYSEFLGMRDTITDEDMLAEKGKAGIQLELERSKQKVGVLQEQIASQRQEFEERMKKMEEMVFKKFADEF